MNFQYCHPARRASPALRDGNCILANFHVSLAGGVAPSPSAGYNTPLLVDSAMPPANIDLHKELKQAIAGLCRGFPDAYWRGRVCPGALSARVVEALTPPRL